MNDQQKKDLFDDFNESLNQKINEIAKDDTREVSDEIKQTNWLQKRIGLITSSHNDDIIPTKKDGAIKTKKGVDYILEVKHQIETGMDSNFATSAAIRWGNEYEYEALDYYNRITNNNVLSGSRDFPEIVFRNDYIKGYGDSPDGITEDGKGVVEIKCPYEGANHLRNCLLEFYDEEQPYFWQCIGHLLYPNVEWCDFVSYDPRYPDGHELKIKIIRLNKSAYLQQIAFAEKRIRFLTEEMNLSLLEIMKAIQ